jgi:UDP-glucose 4-epimerase
MEASIEGGEVFNVSSGNPVSLLELVSTLEDILGQSLKVVHLPARPEDIRHSAAKLDRTSRGLGYTPKISLTQGLQDTVEAFRNSFSHG